MLIYSVVYNLIKQTTAFKCVLNWMKFVHNYGVLLMTFVSLNYVQQRLVRTVGNIRYAKTLVYFINSYFLICLHPFSGVNINNVYPSKRYYN